MTAPKSKNIVWDHGKLTPQDREKVLGQKGAVLWFTGLSGSGKSTVAREVELALIQKGYNAYVLDGDNIRHNLNRDLGFSPEDRSENIRRIAAVSQLFCDAHIITLTAFISPYQEDRNQVRQLIPAGQFFEIYCNAPLEVCEQRDVKGLYKRARAGEIVEFTGISAPYEAPDKPELVLNTGNGDLQKSVKQVIALLTSQGILKK